MTFSECLVEHWAKMGKEQTCHVHEARSPLH